MSYEGCKLVRLTAKIFKPGEFELEQYAKAGLPALVEVDDWEPEAIAPKVADADIVIVVGTPMPRRVIDAMGKARAIARMGTGTDKIDVARATEVGILVANTPFFCIEEMADHAMAMILWLNRKLSGDAARDGRRQPGARTAGDGHHPAHEPLDAGPGRLWAQRGADGAARRGFWHARAGDAPEQERAAR